MQDSEIIQLLFCRNGEAIKKISEKYGGYCFKISNNILNNHDDSEECVNDAYLSVWNSIPPHCPQDLRTYLGKLVRNVSINRYKQNFAHKRGKGMIDQVFDEISDMIPSKFDVDAEISYNQLITDINAFLEKLSKEKRIMFVRRYWYMDSISEISLRLNKTEAAVIMSLSRTRKKLYLFLAERGFEL